MFGDPSANPFRFDKKPLEHVAKISVGHPFESRRFVSQGVKLCRGANVLPGSLDWSDVRFWEPEDCDRFSELALDSGDIILALDRPMISSGLKVAQATESDLPALLVQRVARIRALDKTYQNYLYAALNHPSFWNYCNPTETTIPHISPIELRRFPLLYPSKDIVKQFDCFVKLIMTSARTHRLAMKESELLF
jgi:type I restriction enzyme S subunit